MSLNYLVGDDRQTILSNDMQLYSRDHLRQAGSDFRELWMSAVMLLYPNDDLLHSMPAHKWLHCFFPVALKPARMSVEGNIVADRSTNMSGTYL